MVLRTYSEPLPSSLLGNSSSRSSSSGSALLSLLAEEGHDMIVTPSRHGTLSALEASSRPADTGAVFLLAMDPSIPSGFLIALSNVSCARWSNCFKFSKL